MTKIVQTLILPNSILYTGTAFFAFSHIFLEGRYAGNRRKNNNSISKQPQMHRAWTGAEVV